MPPPQQLLSSCVSFKCLRLFFKVYLSIIILIVVVLPVRTLSDSADSSTPLPTCVEEGWPNFCSALKNTTLLDESAQKELAKREKKAHQIYCDMVRLLTKYDCGQPYSVSQNRSQECQEAYRDWACSVIAESIIYEPGDDEYNPNITHRSLMPLPSCDSICHRVLRVCPYLTPDRVQLGPSGQPALHPSQYGGHPAFYCPSHTSLKFSMLRARASGMSVTAEYFYRNGSEVNLTDELKNSNDTSCCWTYTAALKTEQYSLYEEDDDFDKSQLLHYFDADNHVLVQCLRVPSEPPPSSSTTTSLRDSSDSDGNVNTDLNYVDGDVLPGGDSPSGSSSDGALMSADQPRALPLSKSVTVTEMDVTEADAGILPGDSSESNYYWADDVSPRAKSIQKRNNYNSFLNLMSSSSSAAASSSSASSSSASSVSTRQQYEPQQVQHSLAPPVSSGEEEEDSEGLYGEPVVEDDTEMLVDSHHHHHHSTGGDRNARHPPPDVSLMEEEYFSTVSVRLERSINQGKLEYVQEEQSAWSAGQGGRASQFPSASSSASRATLFIPLISSLPKIQMPAITTIHHNRCFPLFLLFLLLITLLLLLILLLMVLLTRNFLPKLLVLATTPCVSSGLGLVQKTLGHDDEDADDDDAESERRRRRRTKKEQDGGNNYYVGHKMMMMMMRREGQLWWDWIDSFLQLSSSSSLSPASGHMQQHSHSSSYSALQLLREHYMNLVNNNTTNNTNNTTLHNNKYVSNNNNTNTIHDNYWEKNKKNIIIIGNNNISKYYYHNNSNNNTSKNNSGVSSWKKKKKNRGEREEQVLLTVAPTTSGYTSSPHLFMLSRQCYYNLVDVSIMIHQLISTCKFLLEEELLLRSTQQQLLLTQLLQPTNRGYNVSAPQSCYYITIVQLVRMSNVTSVLGDIRHHHHRRHHLLLPVLNPSTAAVTTSTTEPHSPSPALLLWTKSCSQHYKNNNNNTNNNNSYPFKLNRKSCRAPCSSSPLDQQVLKNPTLCSIRTVNPPPQIHSTTTTYSNFTATTTTLGLMLINRIHLSSHCGSSCSCYHCQNNNDSLKTALFSFPTPPPTLPTINNNNNNNNNTSNNYNYIQASWYRWLFAKQNKRRRLTRARTIEWGWGEGIVMMMIRVTTGQMPSYCYIESVQRRRRRRRRRWSSVLLLHSLSLRTEKSGMRTWRNRSRSRNVSNAYCSTIINNNANNNLNTKTITTTKIRIITITIHVTCRTFSTPLLLLIIALVMLIRWVVLLTIVSYLLPVLLIITILLLLTKIIMPLPKLVVPHLGFHQEDQPVSPEQHPVTRVMVMDNKTAGGTVVADIILKIIIIINITIVMLFIRNECGQQSIRPRTAPTA